MEFDKFSFSLLKSSDNSRLGIINTPRGSVDTPAFMPVGTQATVKGVFIDDIIKTGSQIILSNTYHLMLRPGVERISSSGGLHNFMNCKLPILTDSGGFQVMSLSKLNKIDRKKGAIFQSHIDGREYILSPEESIRVQKGLNSDILMVMDECPKKTNDYEKIKLSMNLSTEWALRSKNEFGINSKKALFGIIQGGIYKDLREESIAFNEDKLNTFGIAIGGSLGSNKHEMQEVVNFTASRLKNFRPVHLLGIGDPLDIWSFVDQGIDTFDCVSPTRLARHGSALVRGKKGKINLKNAKYKDQLVPIDSQCLCYTCQTFTLSYIYHLFAAQELLAMQLLTNHNIYFMNNLMKIIRKAIKENNFETVKKAWFES